MTVRSCKGPVVVVGAGQAAAALARALRERSYDGPIRLLGEEPHAPYERPPLSKQVLREGRAHDGLCLLGEEACALHDVALSTGARVVAIDRAAQTVTTDAGEVVGYGTLVLATGGAARTLPGLPSDNRRVFVLRDLGDALALHAALAEVRRVLVVGGGWLGLEVASTVRELGREVTLVESASRLCARSMPAEVSDYLLGMHREQGVDVRLGALAQCAAGPDGISLAGEPFDLAVVAIGLRARDELASAAGLETADGIVTNIDGSTADPNVFAIGDVARIGGPSGLRLESWRHAEAQAKLAAASMMGQASSYGEAPWFWSEQFDRLIQIAGYPGQDLDLLDAEGGDRPLWRYGGPEGVRAVIGIDRARDVRLAHRGMAEWTL